jgi:hypothetical protein
VFAADGSRLTWLGNQSVGTWRAEILLATGATPYVRSGDWVPVLSILVATVTIAILVVRRILDHLTAQRRSAARAATNGSSTASLQNSRRSGRTSAAE